MNKIDYYNYYNIEAFKSIDTMNILKRKNNMKGNKQTLTRQQLIQLKEVSDCGTWNAVINETIELNMFNTSNDFEIPQTAINLLIKDGSFEQKKAVTDLGITLPKSKKDEYLEKHNAFGLKVGDKVLVREIADSGENGWASSWVGSMDNYVGQTLFIKKDNGINGFACENGANNDDFDYPYFVLEKVVEKYIPFTFEDDLLGKHVISKDKSCKGIITFQNQVRVEYGVHIKTYKILFEQYTFMNGSICGKLKE